MQLTLNTQRSNIATCPHGLPLGACPICNGMASGGGKKADFSAKPGEMSWNECAAIGAFLRAQKLARQTKAQDVLNFAKVSEVFQNKLDKISHNITLFNLNAEKMLPRIISAPIIFITKNLIQKPIIFMRNLPVIIQNLSQKLSDAASKITSLIGEKITENKQKIAKLHEKLKRKITSIYEEIINDSNT